MINLKTFEKSFVLKQFMYLEYLKNTYFNGVDTWVEV